MKKTISINTEYDFAFDDIFIETMSTHILFQDMDKLTENAMLHDKTEIKEIASSNQDELHKRIEKFVLDYENKINDIHDNIANMDSCLETAIGLLTEVVNANTVNYEP